MTEEEKPQEEPQSEPEPASEPVKEEPNYEQMYKEQQTRLQEAGERAQKAEGMLDTLNEQGAINWNALSGQDTADAEDDAVGEEFVSRKEFNTALKSKDEYHSNQLLAMQFRVDHPELREYEQSLVIPRIQEIRRLHPAKSASDILNEAVKSATEFLESERARGRAAAEAEKKRKADEAAAASGLSSAATTSAPKKEESTGESYGDYMARRKEQSRKARGLI